MNNGREASPQDKEILEELQRYWGNSVKIDLDITHEPCIFYELYGVWNIVYKLSKDGSYLGNRWTYVQNAHRAIMNFIREQRKISYEQEKRFQDAFERKKREGIPEN